MGDRAIIWLLQKVGVLGGRLCLPPWFVRRPSRCAVLALIGFVAFNIHARAADPIDSAVPAIKEAEGFRGEPYDDTTGNPTIGYGTKLPLTEAEGELLLRYRLGPGDLRCIAHGWSGTVGRRLSGHAGGAGGRGLCAGVRRPARLRRRAGGARTGRYGAAAAEFRASIWYGEEPGRVERVIIMLSG